jgi:hypothetical protein
MITTTEDLQLTINITCGQVTYERGLTIANPRFDGAVEIDMWNRAYDRIAQMASQGCWVKAKYGNRKRDRYLPGRSIDYITIMEGEFR